MKCSLQGDSVIQDFSLMSFTHCTITVIFSLNQFSKKNEVFIILFSLQTLPSKETRFFNTTQMPCLQSASIWSSCEHNSKSQMLTEHVSELDSSFHSVLSLPSGKPPYKLINELMFCKLIF